MLVEVVALCMDKQLREDIARISQLSGYHIGLTYFGLKKTLLDNFKILKKSFKVLCYCNKKFHFISGNNFVKSLFEHK